MNRIKLIKDDITRLDVDAIVNAANRSLLGGGGVDGAIHRAAGPELLAHCRTLGGCETGEAVITPGFRLPARYVIHTVGPVYGSMPAAEAERLLANAYRNSLELAAGHQLKVIAFPNISTGVYDFPKEKAAEIAISNVREFLAGSELPEEVIFVCFDDENFRIYKRMLGVN
ncbi:MAG: O-acetyl-ADP-ribose deacetylase [Saprospiraceae bacterium]